MINMNYPNKNIIKISPVNPTWVNQTIVEYVSYTSGVSLLFNNSIVAIYSLTFP